MECIGDCLVDSGLPCLYLSTFTPKNRKYLKHAYQMLAERRPLEVLKVFVCLLSHYMSLNFPDPMFATEPLYLFTSPSIIFHERPFNDL